MLEVKFDPGQIARLEKALGDKASKLPKHMAKAINDTAKVLQKDTSIEIRKHIKTTAGAVKKQLRAVTRATGHDLQSIVRMSKGAGIPLRDYGARQTKKGVTFSTGKRQGRRLSVGAFEVVKWGRHVFKRDGKKKSSITKLYGPSVWGVMAFNRGLEKDQRIKADAELRKQMERRIREIGLIKAGVITKKKI